MLKVQQIINTPVTSNCFVLYDKTASNDCLIVDPGSKSDEDLFAFLEQVSLSPKYIILTHEHFDHCWGVNQLVKQYHIPIICSQLCAEAIQHEKRNCSVFYDNKISFTINSETISTESLGNKLSLWGTDILFYHTPGHTEASICFTVNDFLFTGDTLLKDTRTVTKLPTGSAVRLEESKALFSKMQGNGFTVFPGHGEIFQLDEYDLNKIK